MKNMKIPRITKLTELHGWHVPGADPKAYEALGEKEEMQCQTM